MISPASAARTKASRSLNVCLCAASRPRVRVWSSLNAISFYRAVGFAPERRARWPVRTGIELDYVLMGKRVGEATPALGKRAPG